MLHNATLWYRDVFMSCFRLQASYGGLGYRFSKDLNDKDAASVEVWISKASSLELAVV